MQRHFVIVFVKGQDVVILPYDPSKHHGSKFLYFVDSDGVETLLVSSNDSQHKDLLMDYERQNGPLDKANLRGAGQIGDGDGGIKSWHSAGFNLRTPEELKPRILELLALPA